MNSSAARASIKKAIVLAIIGICLLVAILTAIERSTQFNFSDLYSSEWLALAVLLQIVTLFLFVFAWFVLLNGQRAVSFSMLEVSAHIGVTLLGKYLPGKVWGLLGRGYLLTQRGMSSASATHFLVVDQFLTFYSGIAVGVFSLLAFVNLYFATIAMVSILIFTPVILNQHPKILSGIKSIAKRLTNKFDENEITNEQQLNTSLLTKVFGIYVLHWLGASLVMYILFLSQLETDLITNLLLMLAAIPLGMLGGFLALWAPGGIGVREGLIILILALNLEWDVAASIAITYRMICVLNDLVMGAIAMTLFSKHSTV